MTDADLEACQAAFPALTWLPIASAPNGIQGVVASLRVEVYQLSSHAVAVAYKANGKRHNHRFDRQLCDTIQANDVPAAANDLRLELVKMRNDLTAALGEP